MNQLSIADSLFATKNFGGDTTEFQTPSTMWRSNTDSGGASGWLDELIVTLTAINSQRNSKTATDESARYAPAANKNITPTTTYF